MRGWGGTDGCRSWDGIDQLLTEPQNLQRKRKNEKWANLPCYPNEMYEFCSQKHVRMHTAVGGICRSLRTVHGCGVGNLSSRWQSNRFIEASGLPTSPPFCSFVQYLPVILRSQPPALWDFIKYSNSIALNINPLTHPLTVIHSLQSLGAWAATECFHYRALGFLLSRALSTDVQPLNKDRIAIIDQVCDKEVQCPGLIMVRVYIRNLGFNVCPSPFQYSYPD